MTAYLSRTLIGFERITSYTPDFYYRPQALDRKVVEKPSDWFSPQASVASHALPHATYASLTGSLKTDVGHWQLSPGVPITMTQKIIAANDNDRAPSADALHTHLIMRCLTLLASFILPRLGKQASPAGLFHIVYVLFLSLLATHTQSVAASKDPADPKTDLLEKDLKTAKSLVETHRLFDNIKAEAVINSNPKSPLYAAYYLLLVFLENDAAIGKLIMAGPHPEKYLADLAHSAKKNPQAWTLVEWLAQNITHDPQIFDEFAEGRLPFNTSVQWAIHMACCSTCDTLSLMLNLTQRRVALETRDFVAALGQDDNDDPPPTERA